MDHYLLRLECLSRVPAGQADEYEYEYEYEYDIDDVNRRKK